MDPEFKWDVLYSGYSSPRERRTKRTSPCACLHAATAGAGEGPRTEQEVRSRRRSELILPSIARRLRVVTLYLYVYYITRTAATRGVLSARVNRAVYSYARRVVSCAAPLFAREPPAERRTANTAASSHRSVSCAVRYKDNNCDDDACPCARALLTSAYPSSRNKSYTYIGALRENVWFSRSEIDGRFD